MPPHFATFFLSTGRCGTQAFAKALAVAAGDTARVEHEPLHFDYMPRRLLGLRDPRALPTAAKVLAHLDEIEETLCTRNYIETGNMCYGALPYLAQRLNDRIRIVHVPRHPVPTAWSMITHHLFQVPKRTDGLEEKVVLTPLDPGAQLAIYRERWPHMPPYERCLYFWAEIQSLGLRWQTELGVPWLRLPFESAFLGRGEGLAALADFIGVNAEVLNLQRRERTDKYRFQSPVDVDPSVIQGHPAIMKIAHTLGYNPMAWDASALRRRYSGPSAYIR